MLGLNVMRLPRNFLRKVYVLSPSRSHIVEIFLIRGAIRQSARKVLTLYYPLYNFYDPMENTNVVFCQYEAHVTMTTIHGQISQICSLRAAKNYLKFTPFFARPQ